jgi:hypothetical protein
LITELSLLKMDTTKVTIHKEPFNAKDFAQYLLTRTAQTMGVAFVTSGIYYNIKKLPSGKFHNSLMVATNIGYASLIYFASHYYLRHTKILPKEMYNHMTSGLLTGALLATVTRRPPSQIAMSALAFSIATAAVYKAYVEYLWWKIRRSLRNKGQEEIVEDSVLQKSYGKLLQLKDYTKEKMTLPEWLTNADAETQAALEILHRYHMVQKQMDHEARMEMLQKHREEEQSKQ